MKKAIILKFRAVDRDIFEAIKNGTKKVKTRAASEKYASIKEGDVLEFVCEGERFEKEVKKVEKFETISSILEKYKPQEINPFCKTAQDIEEMYYSFPDYKKKIQKFGLVAWKI